MNSTPCYDPNKLSVGYMSEGSEPMHHSGVKYICFMDCDGIYRRVELDEVRRTFSKPSTCLTGNSRRHQIARMTCQSCAWGVKLEGCKHVGNCHRHAPTMNGYPVVCLDNRCGDHELDETKVV